MLQCEHNQNGQFASEENDQEPGPRCSEPASLLVHWVHPETPDQPNIEYRCTVDPAHLLLLMDELDANSLDYKVYQLVDVTDAALGAKPMTIQVETTDQEPIFVTTWDASHDTYGEIARH